MEKYRSNLTFGQSLEKIGQNRISVKFKKITSKFVKFKF